MILRPTRITSCSMTLIDNFFCEYSKYFSTLHSGILSNKLSDHQPYFLSIVFPDNTATVWPAVDPAYKRLLNKVGKDKFRATLLEQLSKLILNPDVKASPNDNCRKLVELLSDVYESSLNPRKPCSKRKQPRTPWITKGLLRSINTRDKLCSKILKSKISKRREILERKLKYFKKILRQTCNLAKKRYYENLFERSKNDSRKMWAVINSLINNTSSNLFQLPDIFKVNDEFIDDPKTI